MSDEPNGVADLAARRPFLYALVPLLTGGLYAFGGSNIVFTAVVSVGAALIVLAAWLPDGGVGNRYVRGEIYKWRALMEVMMWMGVVIAAATALAWALS